MEDAAKKIDLIFETFAYQKIWHNTVKVGDKSAYSILIC